MNNKSPIRSAPEIISHATRSTTGIINVRGYMSAIIMGVLAINTAKADVITLSNFNNEDTTVSAPSLIPGGDPSIVLDIPQTPTTYKAKLSSDILGSGTATMRIVIHFSEADVPAETEGPTTVTFSGNYTLSGTSGSSGAPHHMGVLIKFGKVEVVDGVEVYTPETISSFEGGEGALGINYSSTEAFSKDILLHGPGTYRCDITPAKANYSLCNWKIGPITISGDSAPIIPDPTGDPDGDGLNNLYEYVFGTNPKVPNPSPITYSTNTDASDGKEYFTIGFPIHQTDRDIIYTVEGSSDLATWEQVGDDILSGDAQDAHKTIGEIRAPIAGVSRKFFRVRATR